MPSNCSFIVSILRANLWRGVARDALRVLQLATALVWRSLLRLDVEVWTLVRARRSKLAHIARID
jgi:hypothetical protein